MGEVFEFSAFEVDYKDQLVDALFVDELFALTEFVPPCHFHFLKHVVDQSLRPRTIQQLFDP